MAPRPKAQDDAESTVSTTKTSRSSVKSFVSKALNGIKTIKRKAVNLLSPKKRKKQKGPDGSANAPKTTRRAASVEEVDDEDEQPRNKTPRSDSVIELDDSEDSGEEEAESSEAELERMSKEWKSPVYAFYHPVPDIEYVNKRRSHVFKCMAKSCKYMSRRFLDTKDKSSTGNLIKHIKSCWGEEVWRAASECRDANEAREEVVKPVASTGSITASFERKGKGKVTYSHRQHTKTETKAEIVRWVSESLRPYKIVEDRGFKSLMKTGRPEYYIPSASTVSRDVKLVFGRTRERIKKMLKEYEGAINFATDCWTSPNHYAYMAFTAHFEVKGEPIVIVLDVCELPKSHLGFNMALAFAQVLHDFGIENKILSVTTDNASSMDTLSAELAKKINNYSTLNRTRCFTHILNLVAKSFLKQFDVKKAVVDKGVLSDEERDLLDLADGLDDEELATVQERQEDDEDAADDDDDEEGWFDEVAELTEEERAELESAIRPVSRVLVKLRKLSFALVHSTTILLPAWKECLDELDLAIRLMPRDVTTRWNSTYDMVSFASKYKNAIKKVTSDLKNSLRKYELTDEEWSIVAELEDNLKILKDGTEFFSRGSPNLATVLPAMDHIDSKFTDAVRSNSKTHPAIRAALVTAKKTLNRYYSRTDESEVYHIAMVLHPQHKLEYFRQAGWQSDWITTAQDLVEGVFERSYKVFSAVDESMTEDSNAETESDAEKSKNIFDRLPSLKKPSKSKAIRDELQLYLSTPPEAAPKPLQWWNEKRKVYPRLHCMALDYLSIPATSVDVERLFSRGRLVLSHTRSRLSPQSTRALLCLGSWGLAGLVRDKDVEAVAVLDEIAGQIELDRLATVLSTTRRG